MSDEAPASAPEAGTEPKGAEAEPVPAEGPTSAPEAEPAATTASTTAAPEAPFFKQKTHVAIATMLALLAVPGQAQTTQRIPVSEIKPLLALAAERGLRFAHSRTGTLPELVRADEKRLRQILINFVANAIKFSARGRIVVRARATSDDAHRVTLLVEIEDQGIGISPEQLPRLFHPFIQADSSTTREYGGTGLGLIISKRIAEMMGGEVGVSSEVGRGSTFWVSLPRSSPDRPRRPCDDMMMPSQPRSFATSRIASPRR